MAAQGSTWRRCCRGGTHTRRRCLWWCHGVAAGGASALRGALQGAAVLLLGLRLSQPPRDGVWILDLDVYLLIEAELCQSVVVAVVLLY